MFRLDDRVSIVTGASRGIGRSIALALAKAGSAVALVARNRPALEETAERVRAEGRPALVLPVDLKEADCGNVITSTLQEWGRLDILVNNAGVNAAGPIESVSAQVWNEVLDTNLTSLFILCQAAAPPMRARKWGRIVNVSSISAQTGGLAAAVCYSAAKGGVLAFTRTLARDLAADGITVNAIAPGQIETDMGRVPPERLPSLLSRIPLNRLGTPEDIASAALFLCSEEAGYITGTTLDVNGGILMR